MAKLPFPLGYIIPWTHRKEVLKRFSGIDIDEVGCCGSVHVLTLTYTPFPFRLLDVLGCTGCPHSSWGPPQGLGRGLLLWIEAQQPRRPPSRALDLLPSLPSCTANPTAKGKDFWFLSRIFVFFTSTEGSIP
jgi:hypothetical protein